MCSLKMLNDFSKKWQSAYILLQGDNHSKLTLLGLKISEGFLYDTNFCFKIFQKFIPFFQS